MSAAGTSMLGFAPIGPTYANSLLS